MDFAFDDSYHVVMFIPVVVDFSLSHRFPSSHSLFLRNIFLSPRTFLPSQGSLLSSQPLSLLRFLPPH
jgi:hypothetical protein